MQLPNWFLKVIAKQLLRKKEASNKIILKISFLQLIFIRNFFWVIYVLLVRLCELEQEIVSWISGIVSIRKHA